MALVLLLHCTRCGKPTDTAHSRDSVCFECLVRQAIAADLDEYTRLWAKRRRYLRRGATHPDEQLLRVTKRLNAKVHAVIRGEQGVEFFNRLLAEARDRADTVGGRILVAGSVPREMSVIAAAPGVLQRAR